MSASGLGCVKTPTLAARVETSRRNCIPESQIILHTRSVMPSWRIVFSTFRRCMSFYTARVISDRGRRSHMPMLVRFAPKADKRADVLGRPLGAKTGNETLPPSLCTNTCSIVSGSCSKCEAYRSLRLRKEGFLAIQQRSNSGTEHHEICASATPASDSGRCRSRYHFRLLFCSEPSWCVVSDDRNNQDRRSVPGRRRRRHSRALASGRGRSRGPDDGDREPSWRGRGDRNRSRGARCSRW